MVLMKCLCKSVINSNIWQEVNRLSQSAEKQNEPRLLEDGKINKLQEDNEVLKGLVKDLISSNQYLKDTL